MSGLINIIGIRYGNLIVVKKVKAKNKASAYWLCICDCGKRTVAPGCHLKNGHTKSCGCLKHKTKTNLQHGFANKTRTYRTWKEMRQRCLNKNSDKWKWYGGKGVKICQEWIDSYTNFLNDMGERPDNMSLDRINPFGNYEPSNCRWATQKQQMQNTGWHYLKRMKVCVDKIK